MKNEEVVNLFKRYWGYQRLVKRFVIAVEAVLFVFLANEILFGPKPIGFSGFCWVFCGFCLCCSCYMLLYLQLSSLS